MNHLGKTGPQGAAVLAARILRRRGARHRIGGAGAGDLRAAVYVRHEIVHNRYVSKACAPRARFRRRPRRIPDSGAPVIFSAHGVPRSVPAEAARRHLFALDATCPLVTKVHRETEIHYRRGAKSC